MKKKSFKGTKAIYAYVNRLAGGLGVELESIWNEKEKL